MGMRHGLLRTSCSHNPKNTSYLWIFKYGIGILEDKLRDVRQERILNPCFNCLRKLYIRRIVLLYLTKIKKHIPFNEMSWTDSFYLYTLSGSPGYRRQIISVPWTGLFHFYAENETSEQTEQETIANKTSEQTEQETCQCPERACSISALPSGNPHKHWLSSPNFASILLNILIFPLF